MSSRTQNKPNFRMSEGDWVCSDAKCANVNFARRTSCNRCGKDQSDAKVKAGGIEIGKAAAEKSKGLFSANDWQCKTCGNVNWARRNECNMCHTPKFGKLEERTGYGGGYNERGTVEYVAREDSDGEYDEFGRKKKKFRGPLEEKAGVIDSQKGKASGQDLSVNLNKESDDEEEEGGNIDKYRLDGDDDDDDDDDDSDDDADLSKYQLDSADDDDDDDVDLSKYDLAASDEENDKERQRSHSRSRSASSYSGSRSRSRSYSSRSSSRSRSRSRSSSNDSRHYSRSRSSSKKKRYSSRSRSSSYSRGNKRRRSYSSPSRSRSRSRSRERKDAKRR
ncbi:uncharacterized protein LOC144436148 isoform X2 [Glandiceps talaboti]